MMSLNRLFDRHLTDADIERLAHAGIADDASSRVRSHLEHCARCRARIQDRRELSATIATLEGPVAGDTLRARIHARRVQGEKIILPVDAPSLTRANHGTRWIGGAIAAAILVLLLNLMRTPSADAGMTAGTLTLNPSLPLPGVEVTVRYQAPPMLGRHERLVLRARIRLPEDPGYSTGRDIVDLAQLTRTHDGSFSGRFTIPPHIVFATLAVEDSAASIVDDNDGRGWEMLVASGSGSPTLDALDQRAQDLMGRNWEEGFATVRRMVSIYPDSIRAWIWLYTFQRWIGQGEVDSVKTLHRAKLAAFDRAFADASLDGGASGRMAWYARGLDSVIAKRWHDRIMRRFPENTFAVQWRMFQILDTLRLKHDTTRALMELEALHSQAPRDRFEQINGSAASIASRTADTAAIRRLYNRAIVESPSPLSHARSIAIRLSQHPLMRAEGVRRLRGEIAKLETMPRGERRLNETALKQRERREAERRRLLASLGRALIASGERDEGLKALREASAEGWDVDVFRSVYQAALSAGDTATAFLAAARVAADPRTASTYADSVLTASERGGIRAKWPALLDRAKGDFVTRVLAQAEPRSLRGSVRLRDLQGRRDDLSSLGKGRVMVVGIWSRFCQPAIDELPAFAAIATRLERHGVRVVSIVEESAASADLEAFLAKAKLPVTTYLDADHAAGRAFNQWGTPTFYVLDQNGRIQLDGTSEASEALVYAEAFRLAGERTTMR
jgi:thiol-disulfide isomerase/thioredoxin